MKKINLLLLLFVMAVFTLSSCLKDDETTVYPDTAITSFSLGTLNRYVHVKNSKGLDSTYKSTLTGSSYSFYIDQTNRVIYNPDSLPIWTDNSKVICSIGTKNSGYVYYRTLAGDTVYFSASDSINFSSPLNFFVIASDGSAMRSYTIHVNVHKEIADTFMWHKIVDSESDFVDLKGMKAFCKDGNIFVFGNDGNSTEIYSTSETDGSSWSKISKNVTMDTAAYKNVVIKSNVFYAKSNGNILTSTDAITWSSMGPTDIDRLVAASTTELYSIKGKKLQRSLDGGTNWEQESLDDDSTFLPSQDFSYYTMPLASNDSTDRVMLVGNRSDEEFNSDTTAVVWNKIVEYSKGSNNENWIYYDKSADNYYVYAPRLRNLTMVPYDDGVLAFGGDGVGKSKAKAFSQFYQSRDNGITWKNNSLYFFPEGFSSSGSSFAAVVDSKKCLWIICGESGQVWRGRLNRLGWATNKTSYTE
jgi:hypothetical protein